MNIQSRHLRRERRRRELRRRRIGAVSALLACLLAGGLTLLLSGGGSPHAGDAPGVRTPGARAGATQPAHPANSAARERVSGAAGPPGTATVPILMYHVIAAPPAGAPFPGLYVTPAEFAEQVRGLKHAGWHAVTLDELAAYWTHGTSLGAGKPIVLTFDNGYESQYTQALPVLRELGWVADENMQLSGLPPSQGGLGQREIHELVAAGWELDTQGFTHADLITLGSEALSHEVAGSRAEMRRRYGVAVNWFCYPSGHYNATVVAAVRAAGYRGSTTVIPGWAHHDDDPYRLHRLRVLGGTSAGQLLALLAASRSDAPAPPSYNGA